jgi:hypothetical protein
MTRYRVGFGLDNTLFRNYGFIDFEDEASIAARTSPDAHRCWAVTDLRSYGWEVVFVTNRSENVRGVTEEQLQAAFRWFQSDTLHMRDPILPWSAAREHKVGALRRLGLGVYVGDLESDRQAAGLAGWGFLDAGRLVGNLDLLPALLPMPGDSGLHSNISTSTGGPLIVGEPNINEGPVLVPESPEEP